MKPQRSLRARALQWLAQREHSRAEMRRKLLRVAREQASAQQAGDAESAVSASAEACSGGESGAGASAGASAGADGSTATESTEQRVDALLDWLEAGRYLSQQRFIESRVHARAGRFGNLRIRHELRQHALALSDEEARVLAASELQRACAVRTRKFATAPQGAAERAKQARFLAGRGFSQEAIRAALRAAEQPDPSANEPVDESPSEPADASAERAD